MALLRASQKAALQQKASISWRKLGIDWEMYLTQAGDRWRQAFIPLLEGIITEQGTRLNHTYGMQFDVHNLFAEAWFDDYEMKFAQDIMDTTEKDLLVLLQGGMNEGWSIPTMQKHIGTLFEQYMFGGLTGDDFDWFNSRMPNYRREMIARTETMRASNAGNTALYQDWGVPQQEWIATNDGRTRDAHRAAHGQRVNVGEAFSVGGEYLMFPGDPAGSAAMTVNCRCTTVPYNPMWELLDEEGVEPVQQIEGMWQEPVAGANDVTEQIIAAFNQGLAAGENWTFTDVSERIISKQETARRLAEISGMSEKDASEFMLQWARTSNDNDMRSLDMQRVVADWSGLPLSDFTQSKIDDMADKIASSARMRMRIFREDEQTALENVLSRNPKFSALMPDQDMARMTEAIYSNTQDWLRASGAGPGDTVRVRRGVRGVDIQEGWSIGDEITIESNVLESWTLSDSMAYKFAASDVDGVVLEMDVPVEDIFSSARTGIGALLEDELVLLGRNNTARLAAIRPALGW